MSLPLPIHSECSKYFCNSRETDSNQTSGYFSGVDVDVTSNLNLPTSTATIEVSNVDKPESEPFNFNFFLDPPFDLLEKGKNVGQYDDVDYDSPYFFKN